MRSLLLCLLQSVSRANPQTTVDDWPVPNRHTAARPSAPSAFSNVTPDPTAPPPSYHQLVASNQHETDMVNVEAQLIVTRLEDRGYSNTARLLADVFNRTITYRDMQHVEAQLMVERLEVRGYSNNARVLADVFNRTIPYSRIQSGERQHTIGRTNVITETNGLPRLHIPPTNTTEANGHRDLITDPSQRSWRSYFNTADRLRELSNSHTRATLNETDVSSTHHQPRSQTPPPMYHEIEEAAVRIARSNTLP